MSVQRIKHQYELAQAKGQLPDDMNVIGATVSTVFAAGDVINLGGEGLIAYVLTDRATTATIAAGTAAQGLVDGEASVWLPQIEAVVELPADGAVSAIGEEAFVDTGLGYTSDDAAAGATHIGWFLSTGSDTDLVLIGLG